MLTHVLRCTVCCGTFHTKQEWLDHLLQDDHQVKARKAILKWGNAERDCVLIVYSTFPVDCFEVLQFFTGESENSLVTDFIYFPSQPKLGFVQFESKKEAKEVFAKVKGPSVIICDQVAELKKGWKCLNLEWEGQLSSLSPRDVRKQFVSSTGDAEPEDGEEAKRRRDLKTSSTASQPIDPVGEEDSVIATEPPQKPKKKSKKAPKTVSRSNDKQSVTEGANNEKDQDDHQIAEPPTKRLKKTKEVVPKANSESILSQHSNVLSPLEEEKQDVVKVEPPPKRKKKTTHSDPNLSQQLDAICYEMKIPEEELQAAMALKNKLQDALSERYPNCGLSMFRNWYLKLKSSGPGDLLLFLDYKEPNVAEDSDQRTRIILSHNMIRARLELKDFDFLFKDEYGRPEIRLQNRRAALLKEKHLGASLFHKALGIHFTTVNFPHYIPEVQTCRLLDYLLKFDPRAKPLLTLIRYWAAVNDLRLNKEDESFIPGFPPNPAILDWLVILFLCQKGLLPTPRQVGERPHHKFFYDEFDIGFSTDLGFAQSFSSYHITDKNSHALSVLILAQKFFNFYAQNFGCGYLNLVLNTRDGELVPVADFLDHKCQLTEDEIKFIRTGYRHEKSVYRLNVSTGEMTVTMINPLFPRHGFAICPKLLETSVLPAMEATGKKLERALKKCNKKDGGGLDVKSAFKLD